MRVALDILISDSVRVQRALVGDLEHPPANSANALQLSRYERVLPSVRLELRHCILEN